MEKISQENQNRSETISESHITVSTEVLDSNPQKERILKAYKLIVERYKLPEDFLQDEVNQSLLLGACQKLIESSNPTYKKRMKNFIKVLVAPAMTNQKFDPSSLWGRALSKGDRSDEDVEAFIKSIKDDLATEEFKSKHRDLIERSKEAWKKRGYNLDLEVTVVDDKDRNFGKVTGAKAYINPPELKDIRNKKDIKFPFVVVKGRGAEEEGTIRHELYHVEDYFDYIRRGADGTILEFLDELHTEYASDNYASWDYSSIKFFWNKLSYNGNLDFNLLSNREQLIQEIVKNFGFEGLVLFALKTPYPTENQERLEIFIDETERVIVEMLIAQEKLYLSENTPNTEEIKNITLNLQELISIMTPLEGDLDTKYLSIYDLILQPGHGRYQGDRYLSSEIIRNLLQNYTKAIAFIDLCTQKRINGVGNSFDEIISLLKKIPYKSNFNLETSIKDTIKRRGEVIDDINKIHREIYSTLFGRICSYFKSIQYVNCIENSEIRNSILEPFFNELDNAIKICLNSNDEQLLIWFLNSIKNNLTSPDVIEIATTYIKEKYPELADKL